MPLFEEDYVVVNVWTSEDNKAVPGPNVGHVSIQTKLNYISFGPGGRKQNNTPKLFKPVEDIFSPYVGVRPPHFQQTFDDDCLAEAYAEDQMRSISSLEECKPNEVPYIYSKKTRSYRRVNVMPNTIDPDEYLVAAIPLLPNVRIALYGLRNDKIEQQFETLKKHVKGWRMIGSNILSRNIGEESAESCASLALRCLESGGMYNYLASGLSSQTTSVVKPDVLLRQVIAAKENELVKHPETKNFQYAGESNLQDIKQRYRYVNQHASANDDMVALSKVLPSKKSG